MAIIVCTVAGWYVWTYLVPHQRLAPDGTFFLLERLSKTTDFGVYAMPPGTEVHRVSQNGLMLTVNDGRETFEVHASQLTNDLGLAAQLSASESEETRRIQSALEEHNREIAEKKRQMYIEHTRRAEQIEDARRKNAARTPNVLERGPYDQRVVAPGTILYTDQYGRYWIDSLGKKHYVH